jgi:hypothetical protein
VQGRAPRSIRAEEFQKLLNDFCGSQCIDLIVLKSIGNKIYSAIEFGQKLFERPIDLLDLEAFRIHLANTGIIPGKDGIPRKGLLKSRRLMPGGFRDTTIRGWTHPVRAPGSAVKL